MSLNLVPHNLAAGILLAVISCRAPSPSEIDTFVAHFSGMLAPAISSQAIRAPLHIIGKLWPLGNGKLALFFGQSIYKSHNQMRRQG
jgi:hypothetical protein